MLFLFQGSIHYFFFTPVARVGAGNLVAISFLTEGMKKHTKLDIFFHF